MSNFTYEIKDGVGYGQLKNGLSFLFDEKYLEILVAKNWYPSYESGRPYLMDCRGKKLHSYLVECPKGYEIDHISLNTLDNRLSNLRICTHQQNQCNQPLQKNNTSGVTGVSWYPPRNKYRARIKAGQHDIHLGYYETFTEAIQARNVGMECLFGEYGRYTAIADAPGWIREYVEDKCRKFSEFAICGTSVQCDRSARRKSVQVQRGRCR